MTSITYSLSYTGYRAVIGSCETYRERFRHQTCMQDSAFAKRRVGLTVSLFHLYLVYHFTTLALQNQYLSFTVFIEQFIA